MIRVWKQLTVVPFHLPTKHKKLGTCPKLSLYSVDYTLSNFVLLISLLCSMLHTVRQDSVLIC